MVAGKRSQTPIDGSQEELFDEGQYCSDTLSMPVAQAEKQDSDGNGAKVCAVH